MRKFFLAFFLFLSVASLAQPDSCRLRISLLTCTPGEELYSTFGHTAIRVEEKSGIDEVYNYGMFEFSPDFYPKFIRGKLLYALGVESFPDFLSTYQYESRSVAAQELNLSCSQKEALWAALRQNALPQNRYYRYDFLFDNCTTRARDMIIAHAGAPVLLADILPAPQPTFRNMLHTYLDRGGQYWSKLGIDILLGARLDRQVSNKEATFLPDYLMKSADKAKLNDKPLVQAPEKVLVMPSPLNKGSLFRPAIVFGFLLALVLLLSLVKSRKAGTALRVFDKLFFSLLGLAGFLLLFMWFGTDHRVCRDNLNLLWALPTHLAATYLAGRHTEGALTYFKAVFWGTLLLLATWAFLPQQLNPALIPLILLILVRSYLLSKPHAYAHAHN